MSVHARPERPGRAGTQGTRGEDPVVRKFISIPTVWLILSVALVSLAPAPAKAQIAVGISIRVAPPAIPVYVQPPCPVEGYLWTPGYWAYGDTGYYWVPGVWVAPPRVGLLWTP